MSTAARLLLLLSLPAPALASTLEGTVTDAATGAPLPGVAVRVLGQGRQGEEPVAFTAEDGTFLLPDAPDVPWRASLTLPGFDPLVRVIRPDAGPLTVALVPVVSGDEEVVVTASRYSEAVHLSHTNLTREDIEARHTTGDLPTLLEDTPGVRVSSDAGNGMGYTYLSLRGFDQSRVGVMVNGIPLNDPEDHQVYWVDLPDFAESLEDVQVQRGVSNGIGGPAAIGGTVNLVTSVHSVNPTGKAAFYAGSYRTSKEMVAWQSGLRGGRLSTSVRLSHLQSDGYRDRSGTDQWAGFWSTRLVSPRATTELNVYGGHEVTQQAFEGISAAQMEEDRTYNPDFYANSVDDFSQPHLELHHTWRLGERLSWQSSGWWTHGQGFYDNYKDGETASDFSLDQALGLGPDDEVDLTRRKYVVKDQVGLVTRLAWDHPRGRLLVGGDGYLFWSDHRGEVTWASGFTPEDLAGGTPYYQYNGSKIAGAAFANESFEVVRGVTLLAEAHYQHRSYDFMQQEVGGFVGEYRNAYTVTYDFFNPKGGLFVELPWKPGGGRVGLYGYAGLTHREPADAELFDTWYGPDDLGATPMFATREVVEEGGEVAYVRWTDPLVDPESALDFEAGLSWRAATVAFALNGYWMDFRNEIVPYGALDDDGFAVRGNAARTLHAGLEGTLTADLAERWHLAAAGSRSWDRYVDFTIYEDQWDWDTWEYLGTVAHDYAGNPIAQFPSWMASIRASADLGPVTPGLRYRGVGIQYLDNTGDPDRTIHPYHVLDVTCVLRLGTLARPLDGAELDLRLNNALDAHYATGGYYDGWGEGNYYFPAAERNWMAGVRYRF